MAEEKVMAPGAEIQKFYSDWPIGGDYYRDDGYEEFSDGDLQLIKSKEYDVAEVVGYAMWQGRGDKPSVITINGVSIPIPRDWEGPDIADVFKAWRGDARVYSVRLTVEELEKFKAFCTENEWEVL